MQADDERLRQAIRVGNIGIFDHDHETDVIFWSLELRQMYGWDHDEPVTLAKIISHVHPDDAERVIAAVKRAHDPHGTGAFDIEHRIFDRTGRIRWVLTRSKTRFSDVANGRRPVRTIGAVQDLTERRTAAERLRVLDTVLSSSSQAVAIADSRGVLTFANAAVRHLWGYAEDEPLLNRSLSDLCQPADELRAALTGVGQNRIQTIEVPATRLDGSSFHLRITAEGVCDAAGVVTQVLVGFSDVTERKRLEAQLMQSQKMESIGRLAGGVAHDFNNLLTVISGGLALSLENLPAGHPTREHLDDAAEAASSAAELTRHLLAFSRKETIAPRVLDLNEVVKGAQKTILRLIGEHIELQCVSAPDVKRVRFDPVQAQQVLINLAVNARDAMTKGGRLIIKTSNVWLDSAAAAAHVDLAPGAYVRLSVSDDGEGMTEEVRTHLFEPFFTTKAAGKGTGLGLAMVYGAVEQNGGRIEVHSELHRGTTFELYLPAVTDAEPALASSLPSTARAEMPRVTILLVEDDDHVRSFAQSALTRLGHVVHGFGSGRAALSALPALLPRPDVLITDVIMPGMNGRALAEQVKLALPDIRVLFVSGYPEDVIADHGVLKDGVDFLAKPFSVEQLAQRLHEVVAAWPAKASGRVQVGNP